MRRLFLILTFIISGSLWSQDSTITRFYIDGRGPFVVLQPSASGGLSDGDKGDITVSGSGTVWAIDPQAVTLGKIQNINSDRFLGRTAVGLGSVEELTTAQATSMLELFSTITTTQGLVPGSNNLGASYYLDGSGSWSIPAGGGNVSNAGTPADNHIAVWTGTNTIEGDGNFIWTGTQLAVNGTVDITSSLDVTGDITDTFDNIVTINDGLNVTGAVTVGSTVDGRDLAADGTKLDGIETGATADQTGTEIVSAVDTELGQTVWKTGTALTGTGTTISLAGYYQYNFGAASAATTFTTTGAVAGGYAEVLINGGTAPTVTGATQLPNTQAHIASTDMILHIKAFGSTIKYWFTEF